MEETALAKPVELTTREKDALAKWEAKSNRAPLALATSLELYELFLNGYDCEEIAKLNDNKFELGMILDARMRHQWDAKREAHLQSLFGNVVDKVKKTQMEGVMFLSDLLAVTHKLHGNKLKKFLQTGNQKDLGDSFQIGSIDSYRKVAEILLQMTGQGGDKNGKGGKVQVIAQGNVQVIPEATNPKTAEELLALMASQEKK